MWHAVNKIGCTIQGVNDPLEILTGTRAFNNAIFFPQKPVVGVTFLYSFDDSLFCRLIHPGYVIIFAFGFDSNTLEVFCCAGN